MDKITMSIFESIKIQAISRNLPYTLARTGRLPVLKLGHRLLVPRLALEELLRSSVITNFIGHEVQLCNKQLMMAGDSR
jgi:hypothetical protein